MSGSRSPFSPFMAAALVLVGGAMLLAMLLMAGSGLMTGDINNGGAHAGGRGLNGYAALYRLLDKAGYEVALGRDDSVLKQPGLLILTPPQQTKGSDIARMAYTHRRYGPVLVITPKWLAMPVNTQQKGAQKGWVSLTGVAAPEWSGFLDDVGVNVAPSAQTASDGLGHSATLPYPQQVMAGQGEHLQDWVRDGSGRSLVAHYEDDGDHPLVLVFEPDLANNAGMARRENAALMLSIIKDLAPDGQPVIFDLTLNGLGRSPNLLSLAFTPPYLAATWCLILAAIAAGWRAFHRFGPPVAEARALAFGKRALAENAAGLIRHAGRLHLLPVPYAEATRGRIIAALGLSPHAARSANDAAIDRALHAHAPDHEPFSAAFARLRAARRPQDMLRAAHTLHAIERMLTR